MAEELNKIIGDHFVLSQGKIKLRENGDGDVPPVDGQTWARAMLSYTKTPEAVQSYKAANDEGKAQFIDTYFRDMGSMLPQDEVSFALEDFDDALEYDDILNSDFSDVTDDELGTALKTMVDLLRDIAVSEDQLGRRLDRAESRQQLSSDWLLNVRRPVKWIENTLQLTTNDYKQVARAITANKAFSTDDPAWVDKAIASLGSSSSSASAEFLRFLNGSGLIGTVAGGVGVMGLALHYRHNDAAYDRLNSGDTRERFAAARSAIGIASYAVSYGKAIAGGAELIGEFADWSKFTDFATEYRSLPGLGRIVGSASKLGFQPAFEELATQLSVAGTNLKDQASVLRALGRVDTSSGSAFADIGFDFGPLASKIKAFATDDNKVKALTGVAPGSGGVLNLDGRQVVAMLYDITGVDEDYKYILRADTILEQAAANVNPLATGKTQLYEFANLLSQNGMSDAEITKVADELQYATTKLKTAERLQAATQPSTEIGDYNARSKLFERALNSGIPFDDIIGNQTYRDLKHTAVTARAREQALIKPLDDAETALAAAKTARDEARNVMIVAQTAFWDALDKATTADAPFPVAQRDAFITSRDAYNSAQAAVTAATQDRDNLASAYNDAARAARSAEGDVARAVPGQTQRVPAAQYNLDARISDQYMKRNVNPAVIKVEAPEGGAVRYAYGPVLKTIGAATDLFGGALDIGLGIWDINTAVNEADGPDGLGITIGSLEISTGIAGGLAGAAAFGLIPAALSTPFLVISGGISTVNLVISAINSQQFTPPRRLFEESIAENFSDPSVVREGAFEYLDQYESELEFSFDSIANEAAIWG
ncbi:MAG: hypothetical protein HC850_08830 [Rhodomicrobium sp.]|nr:hypothetical protein [Rhodomicrobium sp.]